MSYFHFFSIDTKPNWSSDTSSEVRIRDCGVNTGNLLFTTAIQRQLKYGRFSSGFNFNPDELKANGCSLIVIPAANWVNAYIHVHCENWANRIEKSGLPCFVVGLGAQSNSFSAIPELKKEARRFFDIVAERSKVIGVRGEYSQRVLEHYGIKNTRVIGCPSAYWHCSPDFDLHTDEKKSPTVAFNGTRYHINQNIFNKTSHSEVELWLYKNAYISNSDYIYQSEKEEAELIRTGNFPEMQRTQVDILLQMYGASSENDLKSYILEHGHIFYNAEDWVEAMKKYDFVIGTRLHGCMAGLLAGVPVLLLTHDTRTKELASILGIPHLSCKEFQCLNFSVSQLYRYALSFNYADVYNVNYKNYFDFIQENELSNHLKKPSNLILKRSNLSNEVKKDFLERIVSISSEIEDTIARESQLIKNLNSVEGELGRTNEELLLIQKSLKETKQELSVAEAEIFYQKNVILSAKQWQKSWKKRIFHRWRVPSQEEQNG